jgi:HSP20 family protein
MTATRFDRDPLETMMRLQDDFARALNPRATQPREHMSSRVWSPAVDVYEDNDIIVIRVDLPGMSQSEIDIEMTGDTLTIRGERKFEDEVHRDKYIRVERQYGAFQRSFTIGIPIEPDQVKASYRNGILELSVPKAEVTKPKKVLVSAE